MIGVGISVVGVMIFQAIVFRDRLPLFQKVDGQSMGVWSRDDASRRLGELYENSKIDMYVKSADRPFATFTAKQIGMGADFEKKTKQIVMPLWLRLVPSSVLWAHFLTNNDEPVYKNNEQKISSFITNQFGDNCQVAPKNATLTVKNGSISVVSASDGGECKRAEVEKTLKSAKADVQKTVRVDVPVTPIKPVILDDRAEQLKQTIEQKLGDSISLKVLDKQVSIDKKLC